MQYICCEIKWGLDNIGDGVGVLFNLKKIIIILIWQPAHRQLVIYFRFYFIILYAHKVGNIFGQKKAIHYISESIVNVLHLMPGSVPNLLLPGQALYPLSWIATTLKISLTVLHSPVCGLFFRQFHFPLLPFNSLYVLFCLHAVDRWMVG